MTQSTAIKPTYIDALSGISLQNGVIRLEFASIKPQSNSEENAPEFEPIERLVMTMDTFLKMTQAMNNAIGQMEKNGTLVRREDASSADAIPQSPNFS